MTPRENVMAIYNREQPDAYIDIMSAVTLLPDPVLLSDHAPEGITEYQDSWGVSYILAPGAPGPHPHVTPENAVIKDITRWREQVKFPSLDNLDWSQAKAVSDSVDRTEKMTCVMFAGGIFERSHHLQGMQTALMNYMLEPEATAELLRAIADWKIAYIHQMGREVHPDIIFYHDDWGSKQNLFLPPNLWRELIKPLQKEIADAIHEEGMIYMHHADCICEPIVEDMVEIGIDIWQGCIAQNNIVSIQERTGGKLAISGGIDGPAIDTPMTTEAEIRAEVHRAMDTYLPRGRFFPGIPNGICFRPENDRIEKEEAAIYGRLWAEQHPITQKGGLPT